MLEICVPKKKIYCLKDSYTCAVEFFEGEADLVLVDLFEEVEASYFSGKSSVPFLEEVFRLLLLIRAKYLDAVSSAGVLSVADNEGDGS